MSKKIDLSEIVKNEGKTTGYAIVRSISERNDKNGNPFLVITLSDGENSVEAKVFGESLEYCGYSVGTVVDAEVSSSIYNGNMSYIAYINNVVPENEYDINDYLVSAPISSNKMFKELLKIVDEFENTDLKILCCALLIEHEEKFKNWGAAKSVHHNFSGGLLYHTYRMVKAAEKLTNVYTSVNKDMVIAGCILHDVGKLNELETDIFGNSEYTVDGNLFGHLFIGAEMVKNKGRELKTNPEVLRQLLHIIVSHHENKEWGAIMKPSTIEAYMVSQLDHIDSMLVTFEDETIKLDKGEMSNMNFHTGSCIYRPKV